MSLFFSYKQAKKWLWSTQKKKKNMEKGLDMLVEGSSSFNSKHHN